MNGLRAALQRKTWGYWWTKIGHEPAMCTYSPESQSYLGLHNKKCGHRSREMVLPLHSTLM